MSRLSANRTGVLDILSPIAGRSARLGHSGPGADRHASAMRTKAVLSDRLGAVTPPWSPLSFAPGGVESLSYHRIDS
ncbi:hypothetical protein GCM10009530_23750 [Microbispora corallina]